MTVAILTTTDIQTWSFKKNSPKSTGNLERLLEEDVEIYVLSSRNKFGDHDEWWLKLVDSDKVFHPSEPIFGGASDLTLVNIWRNMYGKLGLLPKSEIRDWLDVRDDLASQGVLTGRALFKHVSRK